MAPNNSPWTDSRVAELKSCIRRKLSGGQTALEMHMTVGQVMGMTHRLGLHFGSTIKKPVKRKPKPICAIFRKTNRTISLPKPVAPYGGFLGIPVRDLPAKACKFIEGEPENALYCGQPAINDGPWCKHHKDLCYHSVMPKRRQTFVRPTISSSLIR